MATDKGGKTTWKSFLFAHEDVDIFRDTSIRYLGYANEVGEAFKTHIPRSIYYGSYVVSSSYCLADAISKGRQVYREGEGHIQSSVLRRRTVETTIEAGVWQGLASVVIPGFTINRICVSSRFILKRVARTMPVTTQTWITTLVGLSMIPVIIKPIDRGVDYLMEGTLNMLREMGVVSKHTDVD
ncbi:mitochondrial fission process protein 1 [Exaiptasia diaphana]|uniref:Mitochondrial fission process protein 1 n=1 Tax=Exaiptasia diaphana TaxID=2652724 RepID=A0A913WV28_EXADI|nr:mitochondrial fission process protein 1 [Exaiptasia diaphana]KXJ27829.1 Mitochondrial fission process protein 1 [Exaiptasia diaphana]